MKFFTLFLSLLFCILFSCQRKTNIIQTTKPTSQKESKIGKDSLSIKVERKKNYPDPIKFTNFLIQSIDDSGIVGDVISITIGKDVLLLDSLTCSIYKANQYNSFWIDSAKCHSIINLLKNAHYDGLMSSTYDVTSLERMFKFVFNDKKKRNDSLYWNLELSLTNQYIRYLNHLRFGKTNPTTIFKEWEYIRDFSITYTAAQFSELLNRNPEALPDKCRPPFKLYSLLRAILVSIDSTEHRKEFEWNRIPYIGKDLVVGDTSWVITKVKNRLLAIGLVPEDSLSTLFDAELLSAINYFQEHVGLTPTGKIDKVTIYKLNFTLQEIEDVVRVNLERCRWLQNGEPLDYYIEVNIADFTLRIYKSNKVIYKTKVVVGRSSNETPLFHSKMSTIEFNPTWRVPASIANKEFLPKLKTDAQFLTRNNMELLSGDSVVNILDFSMYSNDYFPFVIRQKPGLDNSLGLVKFLFPNPYSVYLHDTSSKSLFNRDVRAFSHGCIRVYKPLDLAAFILSDQGFTMKKIQEILETEKTTAIKLENKIPIIITYWTCIADMNNNVFFLKDIYGRDKRILKALNE